MKKYNVISSIILIVFGIATFLLLRFCFKEECKEVFRLLIIAIFTGSIIALPSSLISMFNDNQKSVSEIYLIAESIVNITEDLMNRFNLEKSNNSIGAFFANKEVQDSKEKLVEFYLILRGKTRQLLFGKKHLYVKFEDDIYNYCQKFNVVNISDNKAVQELECLLKNLYNNANELSKKLQEI